MTGPVATCAGAGFARGTQPPLDPPQQLPSQCEAAFDDSDDGPEQNSRVVQNIVAWVAAHGPMDFVFNEWGGSFKVTGYHEFDREWWDGAVRFCTRLACDPFYDSWSRVPYRQKTQIGARLGEWYWGLNFWDRKGLHWFIINRDAREHYLDWKRDLHDHFKKQGGYKDLAKAKRKPPKGLRDKSHWERCCDRFASLEFQRLSKRNKKNCEKHDMVSLHGQNSYMQCLSKKVHNEMSSSSAASVSASQVSVSSSNEAILKRKSSDIGWEYVDLIDPNNMDEVKCILCGKKMSGGFQRLTEHIAHKLGNVSACPKCSKKDQTRCRNALNEPKVKKKSKIQVEAMRSEINISNGNNDEAIDVDELGDVLGSTKAPCTLGMMDKFASVINLESSLSLGKSKEDQTIIDAIFKERINEVKEYVCKWVYEAGIAFNALELDSFKLMMEAVGRFGPGFKPPTRYEMCEPFLKKVVERTRGLLTTHKEEWKLNGCSIMIDACSDRKSRSIMNLCVNSRLGTVFICSGESSDFAHTSEAIYQYVEEAIEEVGPKNVVQIVIDKVSNDMEATKLLKEKRPMIFWTSCAARTINLILESIASLPRFKKVIDQAKALTIFIYAHYETLALMRSYTKKRDIVRSGVTRFASSFLTLQSLAQKRAQLRAMFSNNEWKECKFSKSAMGKTSYMTVMSMDFWTGVTLCLKVFAPLVKVFRIVDGDRKPSMGFVYGELLQAKEDIKNALNNVSENYKSIIDIIDARIKDRLDNPLHLMAYLLNPYYHYKDPLLHLNQDVSLGVIECLDVMFHGDIDMQNKIISEELPLYKNKESIFGKTIAIKACSLNDDKFDPATWWSNFGGLTPHLQRMALRIFSLTTSSLSCERNCPTLEEVHTEKKNRLDTTRLNNLTFVQFNAKLVNKQKRQKERNIEVLLANDAGNAQDWIVDEADDNNEVKSDMGFTLQTISDAMGANESLMPRKSSRLREFDEDDFESEDEEEMNANDVEFESDEDRILEEYGEEEDQSQAI